MRFGILGPTQVWDDGGAPLQLGGPGVRALLARLLVDPGQVVGTERLIDDLYGAAAPARAANALQSQVSRLRRALPDPALVQFHPAGYRLAVARDDVDAHRFARLADEGHRALVAGDVSGAARLLREALALWRGPAFADLVDAPFATTEAVRLEEARLAALADRIEADLALGEHAALVPELRQLVRAHPARERLRGQLMRAFAGSGRQAEALAEYEDARRTLAEELGADPSPELAAVHRAVLRGEAQPPAAPAPPPSPGPRLPAQLTSFVGRDEELRRVAKLLGEARLVTITGPGGAGKTRLAMEAASQHPGETCLVELAPLGTGADVPLAVLTALGLRDAGLRTGTDSRLSPIDRLAAALSDRRLLLVLDNCEHVIADAAGLADRLLRAAPQLRILATSREPLGLTGEALSPLSGLALPPADAGAEQALTYPAVRLFVERAADVVPGFTLDGANRADVLRICRTLDGLPLAIELAAARLRSLPVAEVASRLDDRFALLSRGSRTASPRHRTLRAVVEWSWELLDEPEQRLARRLAVFAGGATLAAVEQVTGSDLETLTSLVDKSLVEVAGDRYRMLDTVRAYAAERLAEAGETEEIRRAHAAYLIDLAWTADPHLRRAEQLAWLARLDVERDNVHAALRGAVAAGDRDTALELVTALSCYWWLRGLRSEAAMLASEVLRILGPEPPAGMAEEYWLCVLNAALGDAGDPALASRFESAPAMLAQLNRKPRQPVLLLLAALTAGPPEGDASEATAMAAQWQELLSDEPWSIAFGPLGIGYVWLFGGELDQAEPLFTEALAAFRAIGERWGMTNALAALAEVADRRGDRTGSITMIDEALRLAGELDSQTDTADLLRLRGDGGIRAGELAAAAADYQASIAAARRAGAPEMVASARLGLAEVARLRGELAEAREFAETAMSECPSGWFTADSIRSEISITLARIAEAEGDPDTARQHYRQALAVAEHVVGTSAAATARDALARLDQPQ
ncbi:MAG TPA: BTAD domain-containing putative transcriptional regulator [Natronosporangium sp.]